MQKVYTLERKHTKIVPKRIQIAYNICDINNITKEGPKDPGIISLGAAQGRTVSKVFFLFFRYNSAFCQ